MRTFQAVRVPRMLRGHVVRPKTCPAKIKCAWQRWNSMRPCPSDGAADWFANRRGSCGTRLFWGRPLRDLVRERNRVLFCGRASNLDSTERNRVLFCGRASNLDMLAAWTLRHSLQRITGLERRLNSNSFRPRSCEALLPSRRCSLVRVFLLSVCAMDRSVPS